MVKGFSPEAMLACTEAFCSYLSESGGRPLDRNDLRLVYSEYRAERKDRMRLPSFGGITHYLQWPHGEHGPRASAVQRHFICIVCCRVFRDANSQQRHLSAAEHSEHATIVCSDVEAKAGSGNASRVATAAATGAAGAASSAGTPPAAFACPLRGCDESFDDVSQLRSHVRTASHYMFFAKAAGKAGKVTPQPMRSSPCYGCVMCGAMYDLKPSLVEHWNHCTQRQEFCKTASKTWRQDAVDITFAAVPPLTIDVDKIDGAVNACIEKSVAGGHITCVLLNKTAGEVHIRRCTLLSKYQVLIITTTAGTRISGWFKVTLKPGVPFHLYLLPSELDSYGFYKGHLHLEFHAAAKDQNYAIDVPVNLRVVSSDFPVVQPSSAYVPPTTSTVSLLQGPTLDGVPPSARRSHTNALGIVIELKPYHVTQEMRSQHARESRTGCILMPLNKGTYLSKFSSLLYFEEMQMERDIRFYTMPKVTMDKQGPYFFLEVPGVVEKRPSVLKGDSIVATMLTADDRPDPSRRYRGFVYEVQQTKLKLSFHESLVASHISGMQFMVEFSYNRFPLSFAHRAIEMVAQHELWPVLFPTYADTARSSKQQGHLELLAKRVKFKNRLIEANEEQQRAVRRIVAGTSGTAPYLIFGPPGTGKTMTMVEAMTQVYYLHEGSRILACAPYNDAADLLAHHLLEHIPKGELIRVNCQSRLKKDITFAEVAEVANYDDAGEVWYPPRDVFKSKRVVVCTLIAAGRLASSELGREFFSHIFIDECGHAIEPEAVIPIGGFVKPDGSGNPTQVVLAGDPRQLSPALRSMEAVRGGLGLSLLERLMRDNPSYQRSSSSKLYNDQLLTKLVRNYRSHPAILEVPNELFYDDELLVCADHVEYTKFARWPRLPAQNFPVIVHGVCGEDEREDKSPSFFNIDEAATVCDYVMELLELKSPKVKPEHIGIIAPYRKQIQKIRLLLENREKRSPVSLDVARIKVGTVEEYQGQERQIIIISTVRSLQHEFMRMDIEHNLGFLRNPKRFNVSLTRAKSLLIVVGNPFLLIKDEWWKRFITYCQKKGAVTPAHLFVDLKGAANGGKESDEEETSGQASAVDIDLESDGTSLLQTVVEPEWRSQL